MTFKDKIRHFTPSWFSISQSTGILSVLLAVCPYQFEGLQVIATVFFFINVLLFTFCMVMTLLRYTLFPHILSLMLNHSAQSLFLGTIPMAFTTLTNFVIVVVIPFFAPQDWPITLAFVMYWIEVVLTVLSVVVVPYYIIIHHNHQLDKMNGTWLLPIVPAVVTAASGGLLATHLTNPDHAKIIILLSFFLLGIGILLALSIIVIYFHRLVVHKLPSNQVIISAFLPLGPLGQGAYGFLMLGTASQQWFDVKTSSAAVADNVIPLLGSMIHACCIVWAMLLWGYGLWFLIVAVFSVIATYKQAKEIPFNMGWWGLIFPFGVFTSATIALGTIWQSIFFNILATVFIVILVILWFIVATFTVHGAFSGKMFFAPCLTPVTNPP
ncbi:voltage-dependent anion channel [Gongronella butleri]|nr:voltage-dependent anion channel [Gongronella butleri]